MTELEMLISGLKWMAFWKDLYLRINGVFRVFLGRRFAKVVPRSISWDKYKQWTQGPGTEDWGPRDPSYLFVSSPFIVALDLEVL